jgi:hypothetical protein
MKIEGLADLINDQSLASAMGQMVRNETADPSIFRGEWIRTLRNRFERYSETLSAIGADIGATQAKTIARVLASATPVEGGGEPDLWCISLEQLLSYKSSLDYLQNHLHLEFNSKKFIMLTSEQVKYLDDDFSLLPTEKFPSLIKESREAARCFALSRWTASVFHAVRCLEAGITALCQCLDVPDPIKGSERSWSAIQRRVKKRMEEKWPLASDQLTPEYIFFDRIYGALAAFQNPYRNETMHLSSSYDEDEAIHIIAMVKGFLAVVAERCDEQGLPKA